MAKRNGRGEKKARFVCLPHDVMDTPAWKRLSCVAMAAWLQFARVHNGSNNGRIAMSARMLGERLNVSKDTASRAIKELVTFGFLVRTRAAVFSSKRVAAEYLMTHVADDRTDPKGIPLRTYQNIGKTHLKIVKWRGRPERAERMGRLADFGITIEVRGRYVVKRFLDHMFDEAETLEFNSAAEAEAYARGIVTVAKSGQNGARKPTNGQSPQKGGPT